MVDETRRYFLKRTFWAAAALGAGGVAYPFVEAKWCKLSNVDVEMPNLPNPFDGTQPKPYVALLVYSKPYVTFIYIWSRH